MAGMAAELVESQVKRRVTLVGAVVNVLLTVAKVALGWIGNSQALIADGMHSLSDLMSDGLVLWASHVGAQGADSNHPYGHARIETLATGLIGALLLAVAIGFVVSAGGRLLSPGTVPTPSAFTLWPAVISVVVKEALFHYTRRAARRVRSPLIDANAWHHRSDALSSVVVIGGIGGALLGAPWLDAVAAIVVAVMIGRMGWRFLWQTMQELVDTGLDAPQIEELRARVMSVEGVRDHHQLRTRMMGSRILVDVHIRVDGDSSLRQAHAIAQQVRRRIQGYSDQVRDVMVSVEPVDEQDWCEGDDADGVRLR